MGNDTYFKRIMQFATEQVCRTCHGHRLQEKFLAVRIQGKNIGELASLSVEDSLKFFATLELSKSHEHIAAPILKNITERLEFLHGV